MTVPLTSTRSRRCKLLFIGCKIGALRSDLTFKKLRVLEVPCLDTALGKIWLNLFHGVDFFRVAHTWPKRRQLVVVCDLGQHERFAVVGDKLPPLRVTSLNKSG